MPTVNIDDLNVVNTLTDELERNLHELGRIYLPTSAVEDACRLKDLYYSILLSAKETLSNKFHLWVKKNDHLLKTIAVFIAKSEGLLVLQNRDFIHLQEDINNLEDEAIMLFQKMKKPIPYQAGKRTFIPIDCRNSIIGGPHTIQDLMAARLVDILKKFNEINGGGELTAVEFLYTINSELLEKIIELNSQLPPIAQLDSKSFFIHEYSEVPDIDLENNSVILKKFIAYLRFQYSKIIQPKIEDTGN